MDQPRVFTIEEANKFLPQITALLKLLQAKRDEVSRAEVKIDSLELIADMKSEVDKGEFTKLIELHQVLVREFYAIVEEIHSFGCYLKDVDMGLIDFYGLVEGKVVFYCWHLGEEKVSYWHEVGSGYASRQSLHVDERESDTQ